MTLQSAISTTSMAEERSHKVRLFKRMKFQSKKIFFNLFLVMTIVFGQRARSFRTYVVNPIKIGLVISQWSIIHKIYRFARYGGGVVNKAIIFMRHLDDA